MLLFPTFVLLVLAAAQVTVCAPMNSAVELVGVAIKSDGGVVESLGKEEVTSSLAAVSAPIPADTGTRGCGCWKHGKSRPEEIKIKIEENPVESSSTQDAIPTGTATEKRGSSTSGTIFNPITIQRYSGRHHDHVNIRVARRRAHTEGLETSLEVFRLDSD